MVKSRIFDNTQLLKEHPELPHYKEEVVCFRSEYKDRSYPANECYFNRELYMIFVLEGRSEILLNGEFIAIEPNMLLIHGANYLTEHLYSSRDIKFITLALSESMRTDDSYLTQITAILLATMRRNIFHFGECFNQRLYIVTVIYIYIIQTHSLEEVTFALTVAVTQFFQILI